MVMFVYIMSNKSYNFYTGVTNNIYRRVNEHKNCFFPNSFTSRYKINKLVYFEYYKNPLEAIQREKFLKKQKRKIKIELIISQNPQFVDLYDSLAELLS